MSWDHTARSMALFAAEVAPRVSSETGELAAVA